MSNQGYHLRKSGERVNELLSRQFVVPTLQEAPTSETLSWQDGGYIVEFRIGEFVRVFDGEDYNFYRLHDKNSNGAVWKEATSVELDHYYTKAQIDEKLSQISVSGGGGVEITTPEQYGQKKENGEIVDNVIYLLLVDNEPYEMYVGLLLIGKKGEGDMGFPYSFPIIF